MFSTFTGNDCEYLSCDWSLVAGTDSPRATDKPGLSYPGCTVGCRKYLIVTIEIILAFHIW